MALLSSFKGEAGGYRVYIYTFNPEEIPLNIAKGVTNKKIKKIVFNNVQENLLLHIGVKL